LAANGYHPLTDYKRALTPEGIYVCSGGAMRQIFQAMLLGSIVTIGGNKKMSSVTSSPNKAALAFMAELLETGKVVPVIDKCYPLNQTAEAFRYLAKDMPKAKSLSRWHRTAKANPFKEQL
jgi:NADPH:quinone reductase-like Zn-dependent oxidoreductase